MRSPLARRAVLLNGLALLVLVMGSLWLNQMRKGLVEARIDGLLSQAGLVSGILADVATVGDPEPMLEADRAMLVLERIPLSATTDLRLYDREGRLIASHAAVSHDIQQRALPERRGAKPMVRLPLSSPLSQDEMAQVLRGEVVTGERHTPHGLHVARVAVPIQRVQAVLGVLVLDGTDIDSVIAAERRALLPFVIAALMVLIISNAWLAGAVVRPMIRLARAADQVRLGTRRRLQVPKMMARKDEIGHLARALEAMTTRLTERAELSAQFAGDVAHELKNPLASIRSAIETLEVVETEADKDQLRKIIAHDVARIDRLVSEILAASRLEAEAATAPMGVLDLSALVGDIVRAYGHLEHDRNVSVQLTSESDGPLWVRGLEDPLGRVVRNLIDNALTFSPAGGCVRVGVQATDGQVEIHVDDDGPGIAPESLPHIFKRFYTHRPNTSKGPGQHSGLGLAIAQQIIEICGGQIRAENRTDEHGQIQGARFVVAFPQQKA